VSLAYLLAGYGAMFARDADGLRGVLAGADALPLGVGAIAGTSLPIDREITRKLLRFERLTENGLDTVGDRDFALDFAYAAARALLHASRVAPTSSISPARSSASPGSRAASPAARR